MTSYEDLNRQAEVWVNTVANQRIHGTTHERPSDRLALERQHLQPFPRWDKVAAFVFEERRVGRDGYVKWDHSYYGVPDGLAEGRVLVRDRQGIVEIWCDGQRVAVHARAQKRGERRRAPGQGSRPNAGDSRPRPKPQALELPEIAVERRPLSVYEAPVAGCTGASS